MFPLTFIGNGSGGGFSGDLLSTYMNREGCTIILLDDISLIVHKRHPRYYNLREGSLTNDVIVRIIYKHDKSIHKLPV